MVILSSFVFRSFLSGFLVFKKFSAKLTRPDAGLIFASTLVSFACAPLAVAEKPIAGEPLTERFDDIWRNAALLGNPKNSDEFSIKLRGRYHGQNFWSDGEGANDDALEHRRLRLGLDVNISAKWELGFDFNMYRRDGDDLINNFDFLSLTYEASDQTEISFGKLRRNPLTREDGTSSNSILTIERSLLSSRFFMDNVGGVYIEHEKGDWTLGGGLLKGSTEEDLRLPTLEGATMLQLNVAKQINNTEVRFDYLHNPGDEDNNDVEPFQHIMSLNSSTRIGKWGLITDLIYASALPEARGDLYGFVVMPHYMLTKKVQLVGRYTWSGSDEDNGIRLLNRYERRVVPEGFEFGDRHQAYYAGANYYLYGHKLKLMAGLEYVDFDSVSGATEVLQGSGAIRFYF